MIIDARSVPSGTVLEAEVCIIGAGAAGITLAREFIKAPFNVVLLESGGMEYSQQTQDLYQGKSIGGRAGFGRFAPLLSENGTWPDGFRGDEHHMGTTRMHRDPK